MYRVHRVSRVEIRRVSRNSRVHLFPWNKKRLLDLSRFSYLKLKLRLAQMERTELYFYDD